MMLISYFFQTDMKQEVILLLAKMRYAIGDYQGALDRIAEVPLDNLVLTDATSRKLKIIGESYAIKGALEAYDLLYSVINLL